MSILKIIEEHEQRQLDRIARLEKRVGELTVENEKLEQIQNIKCEGFVRFMLGRIACPTGLEFDGRDFMTDLQSLLVIIATKRSEGQKSRDENWRPVPWFPEIGFCHRWLDKETGFINCANSVRRMPKEDVPAHLEQRSKWIEALLAECRTIV